VIAPRWKKVARDLTLNRTRTALALVALSIGTFAVGTDLTAYRILTREIRTSFEGTSPPSVILHIDGSGATPDLAREVERVPGVRKAEARGALEGRVLIAPDEYRRLLLFTVDDFDDLKVSTFTLETGSWPRAEGEMVLERSAVPLIHKSVGDLVRMQTPSGVLHDLRITGIVHDPAQSPGWVDGLAYAYINPATLARLGEQPPLNELRIIVQGGADARAVGERARAIAEGRGREVTFVNATVPRHPHADQMEALLFLFGSFGALSLLLGALLAATIVSTLLEEQVRQMGTMKALGATTGQIGWLYTVAVLLLGAAALLLALPASVVTGEAYATFVSGVLNFDIASRAIPAWVFAVEVVLGLGVPLLAAALPVVRASRVTVRDAITSYGTGIRRGDGWRQQSSSGHLAWLGRPTLLSLRNLFRQRGRLALTVGLLGTGGAIFMSAFNVSTSWANTVDSLFKARHYDLDVVLSEAAPASQLESLLGSIDGVSGVETWDSAWAVRPKTASVASEYRLTVTGVPTDTKMFAYPLVAGRWLRPEDTDAIVINHELFADPEAHIRLGDQLPLNVNGQRSTWRVVGVIRELGVQRRGQNVPASAYVSRERFEQLHPTGGKRTRAVLTARERSEDAIDSLTRNVERALDAASLRRITVLPSTYRKTVLLNHLVVIQNFLLAMAALVAVIGGLALTSTMSISMMERTREIGVMRAIGASADAVLRIVVTEGVVVAFLSWIVSVVLAIPLGLRMGDFAGRIFVHSHLDNVASTGAAVGWLGIVLLIGAGASAWPVLANARGTVAEALRYE